MTTGSKSKAIKLPPPPWPIATRNAKCFTALCLSALLTVGFIPTAALADDTTLTDQQATVDAVVETADAETTEADIASDTTFDEVVEAVESTPTEGEVDPAPDYTEPDPSLETDSGEIPTPVDENTSPELGIEYPPPPENSSDNETISVVEELPTENRIVESTADTSNESDLSEETTSRDLSLKNILSENASSAVTTINGFTCEFSSSSNIYTITGYVGKNRDVVVTATLNGHDVKIDPGAFVNNKSIDTLTISEGLDGILLLSGSSVKILNLPSTWVKMKEAQRFTGSDAPQLQAINIATGNPYFKSIDGVVYDKDLRRLVLYPAEKRETTLTLPPTLKYFTGNAFPHENKYLEILNMPSNVYYSVSILSPTTGESVLPNLNTINIGKDVHGFYSGITVAKAFPNLAQINVDPENPRYFSQDGVLYNNDKTSLLCYPPSKKNVSFTAPNSVRHIGSHAFADCRYLTEFIFPAEISAIGSEAFHLCQKTTYFIFLNGINVLDKYTLFGPSVAQPVKTMYFVGDNSVQTLISNITDGYVEYLSFNKYQAIKDSNASKPTNPNNPNSSGTWMQDSTGWWYKNADGSYPKNAWAQIGGAWYHFNKSGYMQTGWQQIGGTWYYLNPSGAMATGWTKVGNTWYYLKSSGAMATGWQQIGGTWYYLNTSGAMQTGWYKVGPKWYYSNASGAMQANRWIGNYYVGSSGAMATSQWVGNYYVDANGLWVK